ncbi:MAG: hypothetical protein R3B90_06365 [Planctomycetaceae bacterium]
MDEVVPGFADGAEQLLPKSFGLDALRRCGRVYAFFETGNLVALTHDGESLWQRSLTEEYGPFESTIGLATSPCQTDDKLFLLIDHEGPSYLLAVDKRTGRTSG